MSGSGVVVRRLWIVLPFAAVMWCATPAMASTAPTATDGEKCTIVGTKHADVLTGTSHKDVICGLGGNDTIRGLGAGDVLDGGSGQDTIDGGSGGDRIYGGTGNDHETGGSGNDRVNGGSGNDVQSGGTGNDVLVGDSGSDNLDGQSGTDALDGGSGSDYCTVGSGDTYKSCVYDRSPAQALSATAEPSTVDVTDADQSVLLRAHITDDTGVALVMLQTATGGPRGTSYAALVSGTTRDGWWESTIWVPRYSAANSSAVRAWVQDRVGRVIQRDLDGSLTVVDRAVDTTAPVAHDLAMTPDHVDVGTAEAPVTFTTHITDDMSGLSSADVVLWSSDPQGHFDYYGTSNVLERISGDARDGVYRAVLTVPKQATGGIWSPEIRVWDVTGNQHSYTGEALYDSHAASWNMPSPYESRLPGGTLTVVGKPYDSVAPQLSEVRIDHSSVDTLPRAADVAISVHGTDVGDGVNHVQVDLTNGDVPMVVQGYLISGTAFDGWWRVDLHFAQGTPPGSYRIQRIWLGDGHNLSVYTVPVHDPDNNYPVLPDDSYRTVDGAPWDGTITIVDNPAAG